MPRRRKRVQYQQVSAFEQGRMLVSGKQVCQTMTLRPIQGMLLRQLCVYGTREEGRTQRRASIGPRNVTTARDDRHLVRMAVTDRTASSTVLSQRWGTATGLVLSASTVRHRLLRAGIVPLDRLPLSKDHQRLRLQWARQRSHWRAEWRNGVFSDESRFNISYNDGRMCVRRYAGERKLRACILQRNRGPTPSVMVWGAIGYNMRCLLLRIEVNLNSNRYIREVLQPEVLPLLQATPHAIFRAGQCPATRGKQCASLLQRRRVSLLPWPARSPDMSPIEHVWDMVGRRLIRQGPPAPTLDALWTRIQTAWRDIPQHDIQGLSDSMP